MVDSTRRDVARTEVIGHSLSSHILDEVTARSARPTTPQVVRNWIVPMALVVAVALLFNMTFYVVDLLVLGDPVTTVGVVEHYLAFTPELITDALPALSTTIVAALGIVLTVIAIIVQLSSERYTGVALMFLRDPVHVAVLSFYVVASLCAIGLSVTLRVDFVPRSLLLLVMALASLGLASMLPYFAYTFWFLEPSNIIERLRVRTRKTSHRGTAAADVDEAERMQDRVLSLMEEITDIANNSIAGRDKIIAGNAVNALRDFVIEYIANKPDEDRPWYRIGRQLSGKPDFIGMDEGLRGELESSRLWVEWATMQEFVGVYQEALGSMQEINSLIAIDTRYVGEIAAGLGHEDVVHMLFRFMNSFLRSAIEVDNSRTACDVLDQYRMLIQELLRLGHANAACEAVGFLRYYGDLAFEEDLPAIAETVAYDVAALCQYAQRHGLDGEEGILNELLNLDPRGPTKSLRQLRSLSGVRRAQTKLALYYLSAGEEAKARMIAEDMRDMAPEALRAVREDLLQAQAPHFWEIVDRGRNLHYLTADELAQLDRFLGWLGVVPKSG